MSVLSLTPSRRGIGAKEFNTGTRKIRRKIDKTHKTLGIDLPIATEFDLQQSIMMGLHLKGKSLY